MVKTKKTVASILAALSGLCFVTGVSLLVYEGGTDEHGSYKENTVND